MVTKPAPDPEVMATLRARIRGIEKSIERGGDGPKTTTPKAPLSLSPALDAALVASSGETAGLVQGALHEIVATPGASGAAGGFAAALLSLMSRSGDAPGADVAGANVVGGGVVLWCQRHRDADEAGALYAPGLATFGLSPAQLVVVRARRDRDVLWAMEEGVKSSALTAVLGEVDELGFTASRRLQLAAETNGVTVLLMRSGGQGGSTTSAAMTRWKVASERTEPAGVDARTGGETAYETRWRLELLRCRGGVPGSWTVEWRDGRLCDATEPASKSETTADRVAVAADLRQRPRQPGQARLAV